MEEVTEGGDLGYRYKTAMYILATSLKPAL